MRRLLPFVFLFIAAHVWSAQLYYSAISINSAQVPSTQTDFPVLVSVTDARFKDVAHSGHVNRSDGFDIRPYTDTTLGTAITGYELERYTASTGELEMWVKVSSLSSSTTPIVLGYGDTTITTNGSSSTTWSNSFETVHHLKDGTTLSVLDSGPNSRATTNHSASATSGQVDGAAAVASASTQYVDITSTAPSTSLTISCWVNATSFPNAYNGTYGMNVGGSPVIILIKSTGKMAVFIGAVQSYDGTGSHTLSTGTWTYLTATYSNAAGLTGYVNAASDKTAAGAGNAPTGTSAANIGRDPVTTSGRYWNGSIDEVRYSSVVRSADWITTEYNNQSAPGTFETLGTEVSLTTTANGWFYFFP